jgi:hypothetical protein
MLSAIYANSSRRHVREMRTHLPAGTPVFDSRLIDFDPLVRICPLEATGIAITPCVELLRRAEELVIVATYYVTIDGRPDR